MLNHYFGIRSYSIYGDRRDIGSNARLGELVGHTANADDALPLDEFRASDDCYFIKTHEHPDGTVADDDMVFYVVRDGRDACISYQRYLLKIAEFEKVTLEEVLTGAVPFGLWGSHILRWHQARQAQVHTFRFEEITRQPDTFANKLSGILQIERSREPFPEFETFRQASPSFFGSGKVGTHKAIFSAADSALFEMYNGPAMRLTGYAEGGVDDSEIVAYSIYCKRLDEEERLRSIVRDLKNRLASAKQQREKLDRKLVIARGEIERQREQKEALSRAHAALAERHNTLLRWTGISAFRWVVARLRAALRRS
ncbi:sulfotransferase domain-containing protein [Methyloceanibacter caenitepidi]|uniref:Sulfotransferase domain-containing protein n=1 Tax=Methyloceanibacter caenitepidi TaxID=1384459 RepID=A0A0A8JZ59_9HYPH|nr:sulfotransferase domain-containing protein [Methyloceanibacter caenitepidi]BAQ15706.1 hypothetical protein GL4_0236 [Methyloceanibacter caenitepidi]